VHKAAALSAGPVFVNERSWMWALSLAAFPVLEAAAIVATRSRLLALAGGVLVGGCVGNLVSAAIWGGVPDPIGVGAVYASLGDFLIVTGLVLLFPAALVFAARNRSRLRESVLAS
jgi:lipoprotein signal peptidase